MNKEITQEQLHHTLTYYYYIHEMTAYEVALFFFIGVIVVCVVVMLVKDGFNTNKKFKCDNRILDNWGDVFGVRRYYASQHLRSDDIDYYWDDDLELWVEMDDSYRKRIIESLHCKEKQQ